MRLPEADRHPPLRAPGPARGGRGRMRPVYSTPFRGAGGPAIRAINSGGVPVEPLAPILALAQPLVLAVTDETLRPRRLDVLLDYAYHVKRDSLEALRPKRESMPAGWESDPAALNDFAWWCFTHRVNHGEAEGIARTAVELTPPGPDLANCLDTLAQLIHARGDTREALALIERAIAQNPGDEYLKEQHARFQELLAQQGGHRQP